MTESAGVLKHRFKKNSRKEGVLMPTTALMSAIFLVDFVTRKAIFDALNNHDSYQFANSTTLHDLSNQAYLTNVNPNNTESGVCVGFEKLIDEKLREYEELAVKKLNKNRENGTDEVTVSAPMQVVHVRRFMITVVCMIDIIYYGGGNNYHERFAANSKRTSQGLYASNQVGASSNNQMDMFGINNDEEMYAVVQGLEEDQNDRIVIANVEEFQNISGIAENEKKIAENINLENVSFGSINTPLMDAATYNNAVKATKDVITSGACEGDTTEMLFGWGEGENNIVRFMLENVCQTKEIRMPSTVFTDTVKVMVMGRKNVIHTADTGAGKTAIMALTAKYLEMGRSEKKVIVIVATLDELNAKVKTFEDMGLSVFIINDNGDGYCLMECLECGIIVTLIDRLVATKMLTNRDWLKRHIHCLFLDEASLMWSQKHFRDVIPRFQKQMAEAKKKAAQGTENEVFPPVCLLDATIPNTPGNDMVVQLKDLFLGENPSAILHNEYNTNEYVNEVQPSIESEVIEISTTEVEEHTRFVKTYEMITKHLRATDAGKRNAYNGVLVMVTTIDEVKAIASKLTKSGIKEKNVFTNYSKHHQLNAFKNFCSNHPNETAVCVTTQPVVGASLNFLHVVFMLDCRDAASFKQNSGRVARLRLETGVVIMVTRKRVVNNMKIAAAKAAKARKARGDGSADPVSFTLESLYTEANECLLKNTCSKEITMKATAINYDGMKKIKCRCINCFEGEDDDKRRVLTPELREEINKLDGCTMVTGGDAGGDVGGDSGGDVGWGGGGDAGGEAGGDAGGDARWGGGGGGSTPVRSSLLSPERPVGKRKEVTPTPTRSTHERENAPPKIAKDGNGSTPRGSASVKETNPSQITDSSSTSQQRSRGGGSTSGGGTNSSHPYFKTPTSMKYNPYANPPTSAKKPNSSQITDSSSTSQQRSQGVGSSSGGGGSLSGGKLPPRLFHIDGKKYGWLCPRSGCGRRRIANLKWFDTNKPRCGWKNKKGSICNAMPGFDKYYNFRIPNPDQTNWPGGWFCLKCGIANGKDKFECFNCKMDVPTKKLSDLDAYFWRK